MSVVYVVFKIEVRRIKLQERVDACTPYWKTSIPNSCIYCRGKPLFYAATLYTYVYFYVFEYWVVKLCRFEHACENEQG